MNNPYGLTDERYTQMTNTCNEDVAVLVEEWGVDVCNKGYDIFDFDGTGLLEINKIDVIGAFEDDAEAAEQAMKDGIKLIPVEELPETFERRYLGWIDTPENRAAIANYCKKRMESIMSMFNLDEGFVMCDVTEVTEDHIHLESWNMDVPKTDFIEVAKLIAKDSYNIHGFHLFEIPHPQVFIFRNKETDQWFDVVKFWDDTWKFSYVTEGENKPADDISHAVRNYEMD